MGKKLQDLLVFLLRLFVIMAILETSVRIYDIASGNIISKDIPNLINSAKKNAHPILEYTGRRSFRGTMEFIEPERFFDVQTNSDGFRTHEFYPKLPGEYRIMILGDSFTYGWNAGQKETYPAVLETLLQKGISRDIRVFSLGISGYSPLKYYLEMKLYADIIKPDLVIVAVDPSDFNDDTAYAKRYLFGSNGLPTMPENAAFIRDNDDIPFTALGPAGDIFTDTAPDRLTDLRLGISLFNYAYRVAYIINDRIRLRTVPPHVVTYTQGMGNLPEKLLTDMVPFTVREATASYSPTFRYLSGIKREADTRNIPVLLLAYPYPWMVSVTEAVNYQMAEFGDVYDMRGNTVYEDLMRIVASRTGIPLLDAVPVFREHPEGMYGRYDPHFNANGYARLAQFVYETLRDRNVIHSPKAW